MITNESRARILRLHLAEQWPIGTIAKELGLHHSTVRGVLVHNGAQQASATRRPRMIDPYVPFLLEELQNHPTLRASRLYSMVKERGYEGRPDHFRCVVAQLRPRKPAEAFLRLRTLPGEQGQVDWGHFGVVKVGQARRKLYGFVLVLSWSRRIFLRFGYDIGMAGFLRGHVQAFAELGGVPRVLLYDNLKSAVLERVGDTIRFHPTLLALAGHYCFEPRPVAPARGNEKGRVERAIQYIRHAFFAGRHFTDLADLNAQADTWCRGEACDRRCPEDRTLRVGQAFDQEQARLRQLPATPFESEERKEVAVGKTPYVRFDLNDYSVPHGCVQRPVVVLATEQRVRVVDGSKVVADHARSYDQRQQIEDPAHIAALVEQKRAARGHRTQDRLLMAVPAVARLLERLAEQDANLGSSVASLVRLLDHYGAQELELAVKRVLANDVPHTAGVRQELEQRRHAQGLPPPIAVTLPDNPKVRNVHVRPHDLGRYDQLGLSNNTNNNKQNKDNDHD